MKSWPDGWIEGWIDGLRMDEYICFGMFLRCAFISFTNNISKLIKSSREEI